ncbi:hypothetical protein [Azospirillum sp. B510]|uniref:hypothetical protein n=1 Tax=Azospirillum sp. (strain B510) TaxID=137722 RepID=UPI0011D05ABF|nr:hypothetical protein [Azospirillum sp. B510]
MPLRDEYTLHQSDLSAFLFAPLWEEKNGTPLSVLSALARLDIDPWAEAARLAVLPKDVAASALAIILRRLPMEQSAMPDTGAAAERAVTLLPAGGSETTVEGTVAPRRGRPTLGQWVAAVTALALSAWILTALLS